MRHRPALICSLHPAHILRGADPESPAEDERSSSVDVLYYFLLYDLAKAWRFAHGEISPWRDVGETFVRDGGGIRRAHPDARGNGTLGDYVGDAAFVRALARVRDAARVEGAFGCDVETDGRDPLRANLTAIGFGTLSDGVSATWECYMAVPEALAIARDLLADRSVEREWWNGLYDRPVLKRHGLPCAHPNGDGMLRHHCAFPGLPHKLDQVAAQFCLAPPWKEEFRRGVKDLPSLVVYNLRDSRGCLLLRKPIADMLAKHRTELPYEVDRQLAGVAIAMREVGYYVDSKERARQSSVQHARLDYMRGELARDFEAIAPAWREALARQLATKARKGDPESYLDRLALRHRQIAERKVSATDVGLLKPKAKADLVALFEVLRIAALSYTRTGLPVTDKSAMEDAAARHPLMRKLIHLREAQHLLATYIDGLPIRADGRVHPDWSITKITGRWSAGKSQNWPKFVPSWPPKTNPDGSWKRKPIMDVSGKVQRRDEQGNLLWGDLVCPIANPRALIAAPTASEILTLGLTPGANVDPRVLTRALEGHGRILVGADEDQVELRIAAHLSKDPFLLDIFARGIDPHSTFAAEAFPKHFPGYTAELAEMGLKGKDDLGEKVSAILRGRGLAVPEEWGDKLTLLDDITRVRFERAADLQANWSKLRDLTKRGEYAKIYRGEAGTVHKSIVKDMPEVTYKNVADLLESIGQKMRGVVAWGLKMETAARLHGEIRTALLGRVRLFPLGNFSINVVANQPIQSFAAFLLARAIFRFVAITEPELIEEERLYTLGFLDRAWVTRWRGRLMAWRAPVWLTINGHDSLVAECDEEDSRQARELLEDAMTQEITIDGVAMTYTAKARVARRASEL